MSGKEEAKKLYPILNGGKEEVWFFIPGHMVNIPFAANEYSNITCLFVSRTAH